jgi:hypothetical protein
MTHWKRTRGTCSNCKKKFYKSIGLATGQEWNDWAFSPEQMSPLQRWWVVNIHLCTNCEQSYNNGLQATPTAASLVEDD